MLHVAHKHHDDVLRVDLELVHFSHLGRNDVECALVLHLFRLFGRVALDLRNGGRAAAKRVEVGEVLGAGSEQTLLLRSIDAQKGTRNVSRLGN